MQQHGWTQRLYRVTYVSQKKTNIMWYHLYVESEKKKGINQILFTATQYSAMWKYYFIFNLKKWVTFYSVAIKSKFQPIVYVRVSTTSTSYIHFIQFSNLSLNNLQQTSEYNSSSSFHTSPLYSRPHYISHLQWSRPFLQIPDFNQPISNIPLPQQAFS